MNWSAIDRVRRFNRVVTREAGALDTSFLGRGRPLGAARVLNAIGNGKNEIAEVRTELGLDSGMLSRLLRSLEEEGLVYIHPDPKDRRRRSGHLTDKGQAEYEAYESLSNERAMHLLQHHLRAKQLLDAMDLIASALGQHHFEIRQTDPEAENARYCLTQYYQELEARFEMGFDVNLSRDPEASDLRPPKGSFLLAWSDGLPVGCVGLKGGKRFAEIKRLWVAPSARGLKLGTTLMTAAETAARDLGITTLRLDTNSALPEASALYEKLGWTEIERFNDDPYADLFFEKVLND